MSTASTVTTLVEMDPTLDDDTEIANQICILFATQGNGTLLCPSSFKEEAAVKLCIGLGQEHPGGVLQLSDTKTVLAFPSNSDIMAASCHLAVATVWHGNPIKLHIWPLMSMQVRDYIAARSSCLSGTQVPVQGREWVPNLFPASPN